MISEILRKTQDNLYQVYKSKVVMPKMEKRLLKLQKKHLKLLVNNLLSYMEKNHLDEMIYNDAQQYRNRIAKDMDTDTTIQFLKKLLNKKDPNTWFNQEQFEKDWRSELETGYAGMSESAFAKFGVFLEFDKMNPKISDFLDSRMNFIKDLPKENFDSLIDILKESYYEKGNHPSVIAKELRSSGLFDEYYSGRATNIARTETSVVTGQASYATHKEQGFDFKYWVDTPDDLTRDAHVENGAVGEIGIEEYYPSGQLCPGDGNDPSLICNCRCSEGYTSGDSESDQDIAIESSLLDSLSFDTFIEKENLNRIELIQLASKYISGMNFSIVVSKSGKTGFSRNTLYIKRKETSLFSILGILVGSTKKDLYRNTKKESDVCKMGAQILMGYDPTTDGIDDIERMAIEAITYIKSFSRKKVNYKWEKIQGKFKPVKAK